MLLSYKKVIAISHRGLGAKLLELPYFILQVTIFLHQALDMLQNMYTYGCFCDVRSCSLMNNLPPPIVFLGLLVCVYPGSRVKAECIDPPLLQEQLEHL